MKLENVVPWGRPMAEYVRMFALTEGDLSGRILDCAGGPASFNAEATALGRRVVSCDPIYRFSAGEISERVGKIYEDMVESIEENADAFVWTHAGSPERHAKARMRAMGIFFEDFPAGLKDGRYVVAALPALPFEDGEFDLAVCSAFLFTYSSQLSRTFHLASVLEMCRVATEARVFPLLTSSVHQDMGVGERSPHLSPVLDGLRERGYDARVERVPYEFQRGGNEMLRVTSSKGQG